MGCGKTALGCLVIILPLALVAFFVTAGVAHIGSHPSKTCTSSSCSNNDNGGGGGD